MFPDPRNEAEARSRRFFEPLVELVQHKGASECRFDRLGGRADGKSGVDPETCTPTGAGHASLCTVWQDPDYDADQRAFYYARVLENPSCRWSTLHCQAAEAQENGAMGDVYRKCRIDPAQEPFYSPTLQERAWTSPIWINPLHTQEESS
jgi:hypothetical protein